MEIKHDDLPALGTKAAAVAAIESMIFRAIGAKDLEPVQLRYWLDAYYQARVAEAGWSRPQETELLRSALTVAERRCEFLNQQLEDLRSYYGSWSPSGKAPTWTEVRDTIARQAGWTKIKDEDGPMRASAPTVETEYSAAPEAAAETQQTAEPAAKPQRQRPVGWTDGNQLPTDPAINSGAAAAAKFKKEQFERLQRFLREGVSMQRIVKAADGNITEDQILGIRECRRVPVAVYRVLEAALDRIETD